MATLDHDVTRVLVPLDGTASARRALDPAVRMARQVNRPLDLVTVYDPVYGRWARDLDALAEATDYDQVEVEVVSGGWPGEVIVDLAREQPGTLVCLTAQHRDRVDRLILGSVSAHVMQHSTGPVLIVGPGFRPEPSPPRYRRLMVCLDGSPRAAAVLPAAQRCAQHADLDVDLVHVASPSEDPAARQALHEHLTGAQRTLRSAGLTTSSQMIDADEPAAAIADLLADDPATIVVVGSHGRTGVARMLIGSVTMDLIERSPVPLLIAPTS